MVTASACGDKMFLTVDETSPEIVAERCQYDDIARDSTGRPAHKAGHKARQSVTVVSHVWHILAHFSQKRDQPMNEPDNAGLNQRVHPRVQFFRLRTDEGFVPIFAFAPQGDADAIAAVVVDMSEGGMQILCSAQGFVQTSYYDCALVRVAPDQDQVGGAWVAQRVWSRAEGMYLKSGFSFAVRTPVTQVLHAQLEHAQHHLLRCVLHPLQEVA